MGGIYAELVPAGSVGNLYVGAEQVRGIFTVNACADPTLPEVEVQILKGDGTGRCLPQGGKGFFGCFVVGMLLYIFLYHLGFGDDVSGYELVDYLVITHQGIEEYTSFEFVEQHGFGLVGQTSHVFQIDRAVLIERGRQGFVGGIDVRNLALVEGYGMVEDVSFQGDAILVAFQRKDFPVVIVHAEEVYIFCIVQVAELTGKVVVQAVQHGAFFQVFFPPVGFIFVQTTVAIPDFSVEGCFAKLFVR